MINLIARTALVVFPLAALLGASNAEAGPSLPEQASPRAHEATARRVTAPEFSGKGTGAALALLVGGVLVATDCIRRRKPVA